MQRRPVPNLARRRNGSAGTFQRGRLLQLAHLKRPNGTARPSAGDTELLPESGDPRCGREQHVRLRLRHPGIGRWWCRVDDGRKRPAWVDRDVALQWVTALAARAIPWHMLSSRQGRRVYVPVLLERLARSELTAIAEEEERRAHTPVPLPAPVHANAHWALFLLILLILWHGLRMGWSLCTFPGLEVPPSGDWIQAGAVDVFRVVRYGEWYRCITALTLHADSEHLFGNVLFGSPFLILLFRRTGLGTGLFVVLLAGSMGNALLCWLYHAEYHVSFGFSTALFGTGGALSAIMALAASEDRNSRVSLRKTLVLLAAAVAVLAMLGTEGDHTDYAAHVLGLLSGMGWGLLAGLGIHRFGEVPAAGQWLAGLFSLGACIFCWWLAFAPK